MSDAQQIEPLAVDADGFRRLIGNPSMSRTKIWELEKRGLIKRVPEIRHPLYTVKSIREFIAGR